MSDAEESFANADARFNEHIKALETLTSSQVTGSGDADTVRRAKKAARFKIELTFDASPENW